MPWQADLLTPPAWGDRYSAEYEHQSRRNRRRRQERRERDRDRRAHEAAAGQGPTPEQAIFGDMARERRRSLEALIELRWTRGFIWRGGPFAGSHEYRRGPFVYRGLVSDEHPILKLLVASTRRAKHLRTGDTKAESEESDSKLLALDSAYCETNKLMRRVLRVELDLIFPSWTALEAAIAEAGVPRPNITVGHQDSHGRIHRPHLFWLVSDAVPFTARASKVHQGLFLAVLRSLTAELLPLGADPGGLSNAHRHKSPLSPLWHRQVGAEEPYTLADLQAQLPLAQATARLKAAARPAAGPIPADHPDPAVAAQSNRVFTTLAPLARERVKWFRDEGCGSFEEFAAELTMEALRLCDYGKSAERTACATAARIAAWTWEHAGRQPGRTPCATPEERKARQAAGGRTGAATRRAGSEAVIVAAALHLRAESGQQPTQAAVVAACGRGERTVRRHWPAVLEALAQADPAPAGEPAIQSADDKKGAAATAALNRPPSFSGSQPLPRLPLPSPFLLPPSIPGVHRGPTEGAGTACESQGDRWRHPVDPRGYLPVSCPSATICALSAEGPGPVLVSEPAQATNWDAIPWDP